MLPLKYILPIKKCYSYSDIYATFLDRSVSTYFFFIVIWSNSLINIFSLLSKSVLFSKFAWANIAAKLFCVNLLSFCVVIYFLWSWASVYFSNSAIFVLCLALLTKFQESTVRTALTCFLLIRHIQSLKQLQFWLHYLAYLNQLK